MVMLPIKFEKLEIVQCGSVYHMWFLACILMFVFTLDMKHKYTDLLR